MGFDEKLIEMVRPRKILYDLKHKEYRNVNKKEIIWKHIGERLNCNPQKCRSRWKGLRDTFQRIKKTLPSGSDPEEDVRWKYYNHLTFLNDYEGYKRKIWNDNTCKKESAKEYVETFNIGEDVLYEFNPANSSISTWSAATALPEERPPSKKRVKAEPPGSTELKEFLSSVSQTIQTIGTNRQETDTGLLFLSLARKIDGANLSISKKYELETKVMALVHETLQQNCCENGTQGESGTSYDNFLPT